MLQNRSALLVRAHLAFLVSALRELSRFWTFTSVPRKLGMNVFQYRTVNDVEYVAWFAALDKSQTVSWTDVTDVNDRELCFARPQLSGDFRFTEKSGLPYWTNHLRNERYVLEIKGYAVLYQYVTQNIIVSPKMKIVFAKLMFGRFWIKLLTGCYANSSLFCVPVERPNGSAVE